MQWQRIDVGFTHPPQLGALTVGNRRQWMCRISHNGGVGPPALSMHRHYLTADANGVFGDSGFFVCLPDSGVRRAFV
jgi:hypothetical protein